jgi:hypothetical protein
VSGTPATHHGAAAMESTVKSGTAVMEIAVVKPTVIKVVKSAVMKTVRSAEPIREED